MLEHGNQRCLAGWFHSLQAWCTDMGTELGLGMVPRVALRSLLPPWRRHLMDMEEALVNDDDVQPLPDWQSLDDQFDAGNFNLFTHAVAIPGMYHILGNVSKGMFSILQRGALLRSGSRACAGSFPNRMCWNAFRGIARTPPITTLR